MWTARPSWHVMSACASVRCLCGCVCASALCVRAYVVQQRLVFCGLRGARYDPVMLEVGGGWVLVRSQRVTATATTATSITITYLRHSLPPIFSEISSPAHKRVKRTHTCGHPE